jgi:hypothetical protein
LIPQISCQSLSVFLLCFEECRQYLFFDCEKAGKFHKTEI